MLRAFALLGLLATGAIAAEVGNISGSQLDQMENRIKSHNYYFFGFGPSAIVNSGSEGLAYHLATGMSREVHPHASVRVIGQTDFQPQSGAGLAGAGLGVMGFFTRSDFSPYLGADLGYGLAWGTSDVVAHFSWGVSAGIQLFRTSSTQIGLESRLFSLMDTTPEGLPMAISGQLAIYY